MERFDLVVIGAGAAGITAAKTAADLGARVALADRGPLGGLCVNRGCLPKKALVTAGRTHRLVREAAASARWSEACGSTGTRCSGDSGRWWRPSGPARTISSGTASGSPTGTARFGDPHIVEVDDTPLGAERFVIAAGSQPEIPEVPGRERLITSDQLLFLPRSRPR